MNSSAIPTNICIHIVCVFLRCVVPVVCECRCWIRCGDGGEEEFHSPIGSTFTNWEWRRIDPTTSVSRSPSIHTRVRMMERWRRVAVGARVRWRRPLHCTALLDSTPTDCGFSPLGGLVARDRPNQQPTHRLSQVSLSTRETLLLCVCEACVPVGAVWYVHVASTLLSPRVSRLLCRVRLETKRCDDDQLTQRPSATHQRHNNARNNQTKNKKAKQKKNSKKGGDGG